MPQRLTINGKVLEVAAPPDTPLLWVLRDELGLTGTKFGCGRGLCGSCTVLVNDEALRSCSTPVAGVAGKKITTIEGLSKDGMHPLQKAWRAEDVPQCGYCPAGQIMSAAGLLRKTRNPSDSQMDEAMGGNLCRCGTYQRIRRAIHRAGAELEAPVPGHISLSLAMAAVAYIPDALAEATSGRCVPDDSCGTPFAVCAAPVDGRGEVS